jgi:syntaxin 1B/2/3
MKFNDLDAITDRLNILHDELVVCTTVEDFKKIHTSFTADIFLASQLIKLIKSQIDSLEVSNRDFEVKYADTPRESDLSFRKLAWAGFSNRLRTSLVKFNRAQTRFETIYAARTGANGLNPDLSDSSPRHNPDNEIHQAFVRARHEENQIKLEDMKRLERSLREIREAFLQIAALVDSQGEMLDCIEFSVVNAKNYSYQANIQLINARKKQRRATWWKAACYFCLVLLAVALGIGIWRLAK